MGRGVKLTTKTSSQDAFDQRTKNGGERVYNTAILVYCGVECLIFGFIRGGRINRCPMKPRRPIDYFKLNSKPYKT